MGTKNMISAREGLEKSDPVSGIFNRVVPNLLGPALLDGVQKVAHAVRDHLGMDVAFVSEFVGDTRIFRHVDTKNGCSPVWPGDTAALENSYCRKIAKGELPQLIADTARVPAAAAIPETRSVPIGAHLSVPLRLSDGHVYGTFCCFSFTPDASLGDRDLKMMRAFAALISSQIDDDIERVRARSVRIQRITTVIESGHPLIVYQPVLRLDDRSIHSAEALARFPGEPKQAPDRWFADAAQSGLRTRLELQAIANAVDGFQPIFERSAIDLKLNVSPDTILNGDLAAVLSTAPPTRVMLEITEHDHVADYTALLGALAPLRSGGVQIAVDDAGAGYASMRHILNLKPDVIKLDISLTQSINADPSKRALARALVSFGEEIGSRVVAEGIETGAELDMLDRLGITYGQGYFLHRPMTAGQLASLL